ncbi:thiamine-phosphate kinase [Plectonema cf. radiosum LEGE 06105]|uniref:Thiamine-monophosphate kinase n=1 Tax=Plectonema cf. radiosum LEGE 06105 TaxID=945769 RepID=A0A8J7JUG3_9CYAN|nr:thiamine-phosphate kinase [Plectonema radiosum]MBE9215009.1 thiamine-phosphate kinase [Plectonema cf. radiosum LEGE 06105]
MQVKEIGEQGLLKILQGFCPPDIIGDDGAVLTTAAEKSLVITTDVLIDKVHFSEITTSPEDVGWRAAAANLSDLAAMGASPLGITVGLGLPGETSVDWVEKLYQGMTQCLQQHNTPIVGGDIVRSPIISVAITAFGQVAPRLTIRRNQADLGDAIVVTGYHGASRAGLELLLNPDLTRNLSEDEKAALIQAHQRPKPRLDILPILWEIVDSHSLTNICGMDSSDGLADAILQVCHSSQVGATIEATQIPLHPAMKPWLTAEQAIEYALYGGEDFELLLCLPKPAASQLVQKLGNSAAIIGTITNGDRQEVLLHDSSKEIPDQVLNLSRGFQHFTN